MKNKSHWWEENPKPDYNEAYGKLSQDDSEVGRDFETYEGDMEHSGAGAALAVLGLLYFAFLLMSSCVEACN